MFVFSIGATAEVPTSPSQSLTRHPAWYTQNLHKYSSAANIPNRRQFAVIISDSDSVASTHFWRDVWLICWTNNDDYVIEYGAHSSSRAVPQIFVRAESQSSCTRSAKAIRWKYCLALAQELRNKQWRIIGFHRTQANHASRKKKSTQTTTVDRIPCFINGYPRDDWWKILVSVDLTNDYFASSDAFGRILERKYKPQTVQLILGTHLAAEYEQQQQRHRHLCVTEEYDVQQIGIGGRLQEQPVKIEQTNISNTIRNGGEHWDRCEWLAVRRYRTICCSIILMEVFMKRHTCIATHTTLRSSALHPTQS